MNLILKNRMNAVTDKSKAQMKKEPEKSKEEPSSMFQRQRVDMLLGELMRKFPLPIIPNPNVPNLAPEQPSRSDPKDANTTNATAATTQTTNTVSSNGNGNNNSNVDFKPPEKRAK